MEESKRTENIATITFSVVGFTAILVNLFLKGVDYINILDAVKDSVGLLITIFVFIVAIRIKSTSESFLDVAENVLKRIQDKYSDFLIGPSYNVEDYKPDETKSTRMKYLFIKTPNHKTKTALIPLEPLLEGVLDVRVSKSTLLHLKFLNTSDEAIAELQNRLRDRILEYIQKNYYGLFELSDKERKYKNSAIIIDFDENKLGRKRFSKAVYNITDMTVRFLLQELVINQASD